MRNVAWISIIPQILFMSLIIFVYYKLELREPILYGALTYLVIVLCLR